MCCLGSLASKAQGDQPGPAAYTTTVASGVSQSSGSFSHSTAAPTAAPYSTDTSTDYSQYNQAYAQVKLLPVSVLNVRRYEIDGRLDA